MVIDANVLYQIAIGNDQVAKALLKRMASGEPVYIATVARRELTVLSPGGKGAEYKALIEDLKIKPAPATKWADRVDFHADNVQSGKIPKGSQDGWMNLDGNVRQFKGTDPVTGLPRATDASVAAETRALDTELFTLDKSFAQRAARLGVKIAPESALPALSGNAALENVATARRLLGLKEVASATGNFLRSRAVAFGTGFKAGLRGAFTAEAIAAEIPMVILTIADKVAAREAVKNISIKFLKEGFAKGVAAAVMAWSDDEVASNLMNHVTEFRIRGLEDPAGFLPASYIFNLAQAKENYAVVSRPSGKRACERLGSAL